MWQKCTPKKKVCIVCGVMVAIIILSGCLYVGIQGKNIENRMWDYLKENGYEEAEIKSVDVKHSFMNVLLSYNEWIVDVVFEDEPTSVYKYTMKDGAIVQSGVSGTTNKEDLQHTVDVDKLIYGDMSVAEEIGITQSDVRIELNSIAFSELAPGQEETYSSEYYIMVDDAWFDYTITYERAAMTVVVGLRSENGTEYSEEVTGGAEGGTIKGIPAGTYEVFVRNSESNNDYKDTTTETLNVTGAMKFVAGQSLSGEMSYSSKAYPVTINEPPELVVVCGEERITALKGTYSWEYSNEDGTCTGVEADSAHPLECKENMPDVGIIYATTSALHPRRAYLEFDVVPTEVEIRYWNEEDWNNTTAESRSLDVQALEIDAADGSYSTDYIVELLEGNYIYEVIAKWSGSEKYSGTAYYSFYTVMGDYELVTDQE